MTRDQGQTTMKEGRNSPGSPLVSRKKGGFEFHWMGLLVVLEEKRTIGWIRIPFGGSCSKSRVGPFRWIWILLGLRRGYREKSTSDSFLSPSLRKFYLRVFPSVLSFSLSFFFCLWTLRLLKSYPSLLPQLGTFSGNVSSSFMVFSCIVKVRKLLLPFIPAPFSDFIIQADCCDRSASSFIFYHVRLRFVLLFPFLSSLFIFGFPSSTRWIINSISVTSTLLFSFFTFTTISGWSL